MFSKVTRSHCNGLPLQAETDDRTYKLLCLDVGLMNALIGLNWQSIVQMDQSRLVNEGAIAEPVCGAAFARDACRHGKPDLNYWLREGRSVNAEVDYVLGLNGQILPVEIKAGATGSLKSLHQFVGRENRKRGCAFLRCSARAAED